MLTCYDCTKRFECLSKHTAPFLKIKLTDPACSRFEPKGVSFTMSTKNNAKKIVKEQTVVLTIQATYILKDGKLINPDFAKAPDKFPIDTIDMNVCPGADKVDIKKIQVFEREG